MHDYRSFKDLYEYIHEEQEDNCTKCARPNGCYRPESNVLFFDASETTDIMFISESPYDYPKEGVKNAQDFTRKELEPGLKHLAESPNAGKPPESKPSDIFEFIYNVFRPIFPEKTQAGRAGLFLRNVYWTHAAKKSFQSYSRAKRLKSAWQCSSQLLIEEMHAIQPRLIVMASSITSRVMLGRGFAELLRTEKRRLLSGGSFLSLRDQCRHNSLMYESLTSGSLRDWDCEIAIFPNPSPAANRWKKLAYHGEAMAWKISKIHEKLRNT